MNIERFIRFYHTVRYLRPVQVYGRIWFRLCRPRVDDRPAPGVREVGRWVDPVCKPRSLMSPWRFSFLNREHLCEFPADWNNNNLDKLWLYNLHYFDDLAASGAEKRRQWHEEYIKQWVQDNQPDHGNGWEPYPTSLRIVNWIKWVLAGNKLSGDAIKSLAVQARFLRKRLEYHLLGNHLFANGKALLFAGLFFEGAEADRWYKKGFDILSEQIPEQILPDGGHFERSPMYHSIILEDMLDLINLMQTYNKKIPSNWINAAEKMIVWLEGMVHPDGGIVLLNDAAFGIAAAPKDLLEYADRFGHCVSKAAPDGVKYFESTGYVRVQKGGAVAFLDVAPVGPEYLPGHAHADTLTFELSLFGQRVIVDSGTSCYGVSDERLRQRGTAAHNTVMINGEDSSEVWGGFRVARRAYPRDVVVEESIGDVSVSGAHDGYCRLSGKPVHSREWVFKEESLEIIDRISGSFKEAVARLYIHPDVTLTCNEGDSEGSLVLPDGRKVQWEATGGRCSVADATYHPEFGLSIANSCLVVCFESSECSIVFTW